MGGLEFVKIEELQCLFRENMVILKSVLLFLLLSFRFVRRQQKGGKAG